MQLPDPHDAGLRFVSISLVIVTALSLRLDWSAESRCPCMTQLSGGCSEVKERMKKAKSGRGKAQAATGKK